MQQEEVVRLFNQFTRIHNQFTVVKRKYLCHLEGQTLYPAEIHVLAVLAERKGISLGEIADCLYITRSAASQMIKKLDRKNFVTKTRDSENERIVRIELTDQGRRAVAEFMGIESEGFKELFQEISTLPEEKIETIDWFLSRLEKMFTRKLQ